MAGLLSGLFGGAPQAQGPGQQRMGLRGLLDPAVAMPVAAALLGNQGNTANLGNAFGALGPAVAQRRDRNRTYDWLRQNAPEYADLIDGGLDGRSAMELYARQRFAEAPKNPASVQEFEYAKATGAFDGNFTDWQTKGIREQDPTFGRERDLRKDYDLDPNIKNYKIVRDNYERIREGAQIQTGAGDIAVIFGYMKMLDPTSVVRENEQATAANAGGIPAHIRNLYNRAMAGDLLPPESRAQIVQAADKIYQQASSNLEDTNTRYGEIAGRYELDPSGVVQAPEQYEPLQIGGPPSEVAPGVTIRKVR